MSNPDKGKDKTQSAENLEQIRRNVLKMFNGDEDVAGEFLKSLTLKQASIEDAKIREQIQKDVAEILSKNEDALKKAIPAGKEIRVYHRPERTEENDGKTVKFPSEISFSIDEPDTAKPKAGRRGGTRNGGKTLVATLDGKTFESTTWIGLLDAVNEALPEADRQKKPDGSFSAHTLMDRMVSRLKGRLTVEQKDAK